MKEKLSRKALWVLVPVLVVGILVGGRAVVSAADRQEAENKAKTCVPEDAVLQGKDREDGVYKFYFFSESTGYSYEVEISRSSGEVREVETELRGGAGSQSVTFTEEDITAKVQELYPGAVVSGIQLGIDEGLYSYVVYFRSDYKYGSLELNAEDGTVLESKIKYGTLVVIPVETGNVTEDTAYLTQEEIRSRVAEAYPDSQMVSVEMDREDGRYVYEVEFFSGDRKYDLVYDALTGEVLEEESKLTNWQPSETTAASTESSETASAPSETDSGSTTAPTEGTTAGENSADSGGASQQISEEQARNIALGKAEGTNAEVYKIHLDRDDGRLLYEGKMRDDANRYEFEIDAYTGVVLKWEMEALHGGQSTSGGSSAEVISVEEASSIALGKAQAGDARITEIQLDEDDGRLIYEGEMRDSLYEYEFEIDAYTGTVIQWEVE